MKRKRGLYKKFQEIRRTDGESASGGRHDGCDYFPLDMTHDRHAVPALMAYAESCEEENPNLAGDLRTRACILQYAMLGQK